MCNPTQTVDLRRLRYFVTVAEELNYGRAAKRLRIAGPSLSQQIKTLERELKVQLFERDRRSVALTPAGLALLPHVRALVAQASELCRRVEQLGFEKLVRLGLVDQCPAESAQRAASMACVSVDSWILPSHTQAARVGSGNLDLAICHADANQLKALGLVAHLIRVDRLHAICAGSAASPVHAADAVVLTETDAHGWLSWNHYAEEFANASDAAMVTIEDGGIAGRGFFEHVRRLRRPILNSPKGPPDPLPPDMVRRPIVAPAPLWTWSLVQRHGDDSPAVRAVVEALTLDVTLPSLGNGAHWLPPDDPHRPMSNSAHTH